MMVLVCFLIAVLVGMGIGGGGFLVIYLTLCMNYEQIIAQGTNLLFFIIAGISSLFIHLRRRSIEIRQLILVLIFALPGTLLGSYFANKIDPDIPRTALGVLLILSGGQTLINTVKKIMEEKRKKF